MASRLHTTTVRFPLDVWPQVKRASERNGIPASQYVREATIARLAASGELHPAASPSQEVIGFARRLDRLERLVHQTALAVGGLRRGHQ